MAQTVTDTVAPAYVDLLASGEASEGAVDAFVEAWHEAREGSPLASRSLHKFLGMTWTEYVWWVANPAALREIAATRKT
jgi:hypothetical protein